MITDPDPLDPRTREFLDKMHKHMDAKIEAGSDYLRGLSRQELEASAQAGAVAVANYAFWLGREGYSFEEMMPILCQAIDVWDLDPQKFPHASEGPFSNDLQILNLSGFHVYRPPDQFFMVLDQQQNEKEEAALWKPLGLPKLIKEHLYTAKKLRAKLDREAASCPVWTFGKLYSVG
jgi:hypothetical protein